MLRAFFVLLSLITDYDTVSSLCRQALTVGLANSCNLSIVGFLFLLSRVRRTVKSTDKMHVTALRSGSSLPHLMGNEGRHLRRS